MQYLYGAAVQGIQQFIFQTNELKDIVGASELVESICTEEFKSYAKNGEAIINAAGNIKFLFYDEEDCKKAVLEFPKSVMSKAVGITISQAVVEYDENGDKEFGYYIDLLESRLRTQRNRPVHPLNLGMIGIQRSRATGMPESVLSEEGEHQDLATVKKRVYTDEAHNSLCNKIFGKKHEGKTTTNISKFTGQNDWLAIVHADGNGLGMVVSKIGKDKDLFLLFSRFLNDSTQEAARIAYDRLEAEQKVDGKGIIPIRPIVLGGDDLTIVCRADIAVPFAKEFMSAFEARTEEHMKKIFEKADLPFTHLTACAGIAYIKSSYPFYYGYDLAEALCDRAKSDAKKEEHLKGGLAPSCMMFHKVQDSFVENYKQIAQRELTPSAGHSYEFGPYYVNDMLGRWTIDCLIKKCNSLIGLKANKEGNAVKSHLRQWLSLMKNPNVAEQKTRRVIDMLGDKEKLVKIVNEATTAEKRMIGENESKELVLCYPAYDILSLVSLANQDTRQSNNRN